MSELEDTFGRRFTYLRLSVTSKCNFRCVYCLPDGYCKTTHSELSVAEISRLVSAFAELGLYKVRLTGGEPTIRKDIFEIIEAVSRVDGIKKVGITTNGFRLKKQVKKFRAAGINALNISVDSLDRSRYREITGVDRLPEVLEGIERALELGFDSLKVNAVLLRQMNYVDFDLFLEWVRKTPVGVRFIELMETNDNFSLFNKQHLSADQLRSQLLEQGWDEIPRSDDAGPAQSFSHPDFLGNIGLIAPYSKDFCKSCNRMRVSSTGQLQLCLFGSDSHSLRDLLQDDSQQPELIEQIKTLVLRKERGHYLHQGISGITGNLASIGG